MASRITPHMRKTLENEYWLKRNLNQNQRIRFHVLGISFFALVFFILLATNCCPEQIMSPAQKIFEEILTQRKIPYKINSEGNYFIMANGVELNVSLNNIRAVPTFLNHFL